MSPSVNAAASGGTTPPASTPAAPAGNAIPSEQTFLQLLVAQIKNQDPMNPTDGVQFLSQLAQFSQLEQLIQIHGDLQGIRQQLPPATGSSAGADANAGTAPK